MDKIVIVIPVYNEEELLTGNTESLMEFLNSLGMKYHIILSSNGSTDRTNLLGKELQRRYPQVKFISTPHRGVGKAFREALPLANCEKIISMDMDLTVDLAFVNKAKDLLDDYEIVIGSKIQGLQRRSWFRKAGSQFYVFIAKKMLRLEYNDYAPSGKAYRKSVVQKYLDGKDNGTTYVVETVYRAKKDGHKIIQIPIDCDDRRKSKFNLLQEGVYKFSHLFRMCFKEIF